MAARRAKARVGVLGLGIMGGAFARHLLDAGFHVVGYDVRRPAIAAFKRLGGTPALSAADLAGRVPVLITSLPSIKAFETAFFGKEGVAASALTGTIVIEASTLPLAVKERAQKRLAKYGIVLLDCPISGTGAQAAAKDAVVYASGPRAAFARCAKIFTGFARAAHYCGPFGAGSKLKFVANLLVTIHNLSAAEAMVLGEKAGVDLKLLQTVIADGAGTSRMFEVRGPMMSAGRYDKATMKLDVYQKDIDIIRAYARTLKCPTPLFKASLGYYTRALRQGRAKQDTAAVHAVLRQEARLAGKPGVRRRAK
jgi:3-hydroxyisobutyrate dehydrogenase-like beta-hydroxyacid dehydrogenase